MVEIEIEIKIEIKKQYCLSNIMYIFFVESL